MADVHEVLNLDDRLVVACPIGADVDHDRGDGGDGAFQIVRYALEKVAAAAAVADLVVQIG